MFSASCVMIFGLLVPYGAGVNVGCCVGVTSARVIRGGDLLGAAFGVGMLYWTKLESHAVGFIGGTAPRVLLRVFLRWVRFVVFNTLGAVGLVEVVTFGALVTLWNDGSGIGSADVGNCPPEWSPSVASLWTLPSRKLVIFLSMLAWAFYCWVSVQHLWWLLLSPPLIPWCAQQVKS